MPLIYKKSIILLSLLIVSCDISETPIFKKFSEEKNVLGSKLKPCSLVPVTGYFRDGQCRTNKDDYGIHVVCARIDQEFLEFSMSRGNDLIHAVPGTSFDGLKEGQKWCLCVERWIEAYQAGQAPMLDLEATSAYTLNYVPLDSLKEYDLNNIVK